MKKIKGMIAILMTMLMMMAMAISVSAQDVTVGTGNGSITIDNATIGQSYSLYKLFDASISADGKNVVYTTTKTNLVAGGKDGAQWFAVNAAKEVTATPALNETVLKSDDFKTWAAAYGQQVGVTTKATENSLTFNQIPYGYYYVQSSLGAAISVTTTQPDVNIIDKNQDNTWKDGKVIVLNKGKADENKVKLTTDEINKPIDFELSIDASNYVGPEKVFRYFITDVLPEGMKFQAGSIKVFVDKEEITIGGSSKKYSIIFYVDENMTRTTSDITEARAFKIYIPWTDNDAKTGNSLYANKAVLRVEYQAFLSSALADKIDYTGPNTNIAKYDYYKGEEDPNNDPDHHIPEESTDTYISEIELFKYTENNGQKSPLEGAEFTLERMDGGAAVGTVIYTKGTRFVQDSNGAYWKLNDGTYTTTNPSTPGVAASQYDSVTTKYRLEEFSTVQGKGQGETVIKAYVGSDGKLKFSGLYPGKYRITESVVPSGYNKAADVEFDVIFNSNTKKFEVGNNSSGVTYDDANNRFKVEVENKSGTTLPATGGMGTRLFYLIGSIMAVGAGVILVTRKRMRNR